MKIDTWEKSHVKREAGIGARHPQETSVIAKAYWQLLEAQREAWGRPVYRAFRKN